MKIAYEDRRLRPETLERIDQANRVIEEFAAQGYVLTVRQLYYQLVTENLIPNTLKSYKRLSDVINAGRLNGLIDWESIEDRTRGIVEQPSWDGPENIIRSAAANFKLDMWEDQEHRIEVWIEKEALAGVVAGVCKNYDVPFLSCRGYVSQSEMWRAGGRMIEYAEHGYQPVVIHLGDHDPSGIDMTRDNLHRLEMFAEQHVEVRRIALNMDQIKTYKPPPNPAKSVDPRFEDYTLKFGYESWELDALKPSVIVDLIKNEVESFIDRRAWNRTIEKELKYKAELNMVADDWDKAVKAVKDE